MSELEENVAGTVAAQPEEDAETAEAPEVPEAGSAPEEAAASDQAAEAEAGAEPKAERPVAPKAPARRQLPNRPAPDPVSRLSLPLPGGQCNVRMGKGAIETLGRDVKSIVGKPRLAFLVVSDDVRPKLAKRIRMQLADGEFQVAEVEVEAGPACCDLAHAGKLYKQMAKAGLTADDVVVAVGTSDVLSLASFVAGTWCGGTPLVMVPCDLLACIEPAITPRPLDVKGLTEAIRTKSHPKMLVCDTNEFDVADGEAALMSRALFVSTAMADNQNAFNRLVTRVDAIASGDYEETRTQVFDAMKSRTRMASSTAAAVRQGLGYGRTLAVVLARHLPDAAPSALLAEGLRFESRLAISVDENTDIDMVFAQDALLDKLGLREVPCDLDPGQIAEELREERFRRSNRFLLTVPLSAGKVRLTSIPEDVLAEHLAAFCASRRALR